MFRYSEGNLKQFAFQKMEPQNFLCQAWVSDERIIAGTDSGRLLLFESGELKSEFHVGGGGANASAPTRYESVIDIIDKSAKKQKGQGLNPGCCHCVVFLGSELTVHVTLLDY